MYNEIWYIIKIKCRCESYAYRAIILLLKVCLISKSILIIGPLSFHHSHISHNNSFASKAFLVIGNVHLALFALRSSQTLLEIKRIVFLLKILSRKPSFFKKIWLIDIMSLQCCCHTITCSHLKLLFSLVMFTLLYLPWDPYKLCWKKTKLFFYKISFTFLYVYLLISCIGLKTNLPTSLLNFIR